jgi:hypothetical protein
MTMTTTCGQTADSAGRRHALLIATSRYIDPTLHRLRASSGRAGPPRTADRSGRRIFRLRHQDRRRREDRSGGGDRAVIFRAQAGRLGAALPLRPRHQKRLREAVLRRQQNTDLALPRSTAISSSFVRDLLDECQAGSKLVLLDCCYSGAFSQGLVPKSVQENVNLDEQ